MLTPAQIRQFVRDGYVCLPDVFPPAVAEAARAILWRDTGCSPDDPASWHTPVIRLGWYGQPPFAAAAASPRLHAAFDQLVGPGRWLAPGALGTFPVRFPSPADPGDAGWHIDPGFGVEENPHDFLAWRSNIASRGRALLMLFLFSDVGRHDAPTRLRVGSHRHIARRLAAAGEAGLSLRELAEAGFAGSEGAPEMQATGRAGTVYLCHPFLVHAAQPHRGTRPRFMAQPPLLPSAPFRLHAPPEQMFPVEQAIHAALAETPAPRRRRIARFR